MKRVILVITIVILGVIMAVKVTQPVNCVVSASNPYKDMPMVCKVVLKNPLND